MTFRVVALVIAWMIGPPAAFAQERDRPQVTSGRVTDARPVVDGVVDDAVWNGAPPFSRFIQQEPNEGEPASERTEIRFLLDRQNLYVAVVCFDAEPQNIVVSQSRRDADLGDTDSVRILLDTFNDGQNAFVFGTNPFGIEYDGQVMAEGQTGQGGGGGGGGGFNVNWDADWTVRAQTTARGWEAEHRRSHRTCGWHCSIAAAPDSSSSITTGATPRRSRPTSCWDVRSWRSTHACSIFRN